MAKSIRFLTPRPDGTRLTLTPIETASTTSSPVLLNHIDPSATRVLSVHTRNSEYPSRPTRPAKQAARIASRIRVWRGTRDTYGDLVLPSSSGRWIYPVRAIVGLIRPDDPRMVGCWLGKKVEMLDSGRRWAQIRLGSEKKSGRDSHGHISSLSHIAKGPLAIEPSSQGRQDLEDALKHIRVLSQPTWLRTSELVFDGRVTQARLERQQGHLR